MADDPTKVEDTLTYIVQFLRDQGFTEAEKSLVYEIRGRLDPSLAPGYGTQGLHLIGQHSEVPIQHEHQSYVIPGFEARPSQANPIHGLASGSSAGPGTIGYRKPMPTAEPFVPQYYSGAEVDHATLWITTQGQWQTHDNGADEYIDDEDVGYSRQDVSGQDAFVSREIDLSDDDATGRGGILYHKAMYEMELEGAGSMGSDVALFGKPPYGAWGAEPAVGNETAGASPPVSHLSGSSRGKADGKVVVLDPVHPRSGRSPHSVPSRTSSDLGLVLPPHVDVVDVLEVPEIPSLPTDKSIAAGSGGSQHSRGRPANTARATADRASEALKGWSLPLRDNLVDLGGFLGPPVSAFVDKVSGGLLGRRVDGISPGIGETGLPFAGETPFTPDTATPPSRLASASRPPQGLHLATTPSAGGASEPDDSENFTFCVTPPSEPAAPSALFGTWSSFSNLRNKSNMSSAHSSGYNTEDEGTPNKLGSSAPAMVETSLKSSGSSGNKAVFTSAFKAASKGIPLSDTVPQGDEVPPATPSPPASAVQGMGWSTSATSSSTTSAPSSQADPPDAAPPPAKGGPEGAGRSRHPDCTGRSRKAH
eukprot:jgi/Botrbrau1/20739/Bobra.0058s0067.1